MCRTSYSRGTGCAVPRCACTSKRHERRDPAGESKKGEKRSSQGEKTLQDVDRGMLADLSPLGALLTNTCMQTWFLSHLYMHLPEALYKQRHTELQT